MKILNIVLNTFTHDSRVLKTSIFLKNQGYDVTVVALHDGDLAEQDEINDIVVKRIKLKTKKLSKNRFIQLIKLREFIDRVIDLATKGNVDILHVNDLQGLIVGYFVKKSNAELKIIYDSHEWQIDHKPNQSILRIKLLYFIERFFIKAANHIIVVSESIAKEYERVYSIKKPYVVLNTPNYIENFYKSNIFRDKFGLNSKKIFIYQGSINVGRGIESILDVASHLDEYNFLFMGNGSLVSYIESHQKYNNNIFYVPSVPHSDILNYTSSADYGICLIEDCCLSYKYCLPNKLFEYLMAGIPVIVSNLPELKKIVEKFNVGVVVETNDSIGLEKAILKIQEMDYKELSYNAYELTKKLNWESQEKVLAEVYHVI